MARLPWSGIAPRSPRNRSWFENSRKPTQGLVLSGGGARASFQIGALRYLYDHAGIAPTTLVGTSAGSILTAFLAQFSDPEEQSGALRALENVWMSLTNSDQMFMPRPWFLRLQERSSKWLELLQTESERPEPKRSLPRISLFRSPTEAADEIATDEDARAVEPEELSGQARTLAIALSNPVAPARSFSPTLALGLMNMLPRLRATGDDVSMILRGADASRSMYHPGPVLTTLLDEEFFRSEAVAESGVTVRVAMVALESGELRFMTETGEMVDRENRPLPHIPRQDLSLGLLASCSIPAVFPPVKIGEEWYVDGGVREATPAEMAIGHLGVDRCWVVASSATEAPPADSFESKSMLNVMLRSTQILSEETERDEIAYAQVAGATVIEPELFVHDATTVVIGLMHINRDYGWLRAAEQHLNLHESTVALHRRIIGNRLRALDLEDKVLLGDPPEPLLRELARVKLQIREDISWLDPKQLPEGAQDWWRSWEKHDPPVTVPAPWLTQA
ncbi:patatin-like phospholipase family protein [Aestuariimicrobium sp. p3-SID1156]|uniref:patatin-like phospholipase family protein n=1 Tax=Aestuariimicrobium sp. p3-SID1156 TaxID=2916038 RepID=UPI00223AF465|nr:patatin-like phospholipase family protein [Aestuariimicrobium sp. p3-SID1156]MCT1458741.1 patatin-like phospholipase family protein [Aestuariimicrobium sp. p3-SID1156]